MIDLRAALAPYGEDIDARRLDVLDGVRALLVFLVAWFHIWQQSWLSPWVMVGERFVSLDFLPRAGYMMVDGMLLLSGLLLYLPCAGEKGVMPKTWPFYKKRLVRVAPSYLLCVLIMLVFVALPEIRYPSAQMALADVGAHLTFTHTFFSFSYIGTPLNGALWTLAVEMQFYLLFPLLARAYKKWPLPTFLLMAAAAFTYRAYVSTLKDTAMYINQLPAFLDVYALGFFFAEVICRLRARLKEEKRSEKALFTLLAVLCAAAVVMVLKEQAGLNGYENIRQGQMAHRFPLVVSLGGMMVCLCFSLPAVRFLFGNGLMRFFAAVSFQFYIWHQVFAVQLKKWGIPAAQGAEPWVSAERPWQLGYTWASFLGALLIASLVTFAFERPVSRALLKRRA